jgi:hypothetical protein
VSKLLLLLLSIPDFSIVLVHPPKYPLTTVLPLVASFGQAHLYHHSHSHLVHYHRQVIGKHWPTHFQSLHPNYKPSQAIACSTLLGSSPPTPPRPALAPASSWPLHHCLSQSLPSIHLWFLALLDQQLSFLPTPGQVLYEVTTKPQAFLHHTLHFEPRHTLRSAVEPFALLL